MFLAVALVAGYSVLMLQAGRQRSAVQHVWDLGGYVARESDSRGQGNEVPGWYQAIFGDEFLNAVRAVRLAGTDATDDDLVYLARLKRLQFLDLTDTRIRDPGLPRLSGLQDLSMLSLNGTAVTDQGLAALRSCAALRVLSLEETQITDDGLRTLAQLQSLQWLNLSQTSITDEGLLRLARCRQLRVLVVEGCDVTPDGIAALTSALPRLEVYDAELRRPFFWQMTPDR